MGHDFILTPAIEHGWGGKVPIEQPLIEWARQFQDKSKTAIDVGAHVGDWSVDMSQYSEDVHAFEAQRLTYGLLIANCSWYTNVQCHNMALSDEKGPATLHLVGRDGGKSSLLKTPIHVELSHEYVRMVPLDWYDIDNIALIKIDVEGHERQVIKGALKTLQRSGWPRIIFECWSYPWFTSQKAKLMDYIASLGYTVIPIDWPDMYLAERRA